MVSGWSMVASCGWKGLRLISQTEGIRARESGGEEGGSKKLEQERPGR